MAHQQANAAAPTNSAAIGRHERPIRARAGFPQTGRFWQFRRAAEIQKSARSRETVEHMKTGRLYGTEPQDSGWRPPQAEEGAAVGAWAPSPSRAGSPVAAPCPSWGSLVAGGGGRLCRATTLCYTGQHRMNLVSRSPVVV